MNRMDIEWWLDRELHRALSPGAPVSTSILHYALEALRDSTIHVFRVREAAHESYTR